MNRAIRVSLQLEEGKKNRDINDFDMFNFLRAKFSTSRTTESTLWDLMSECVSNK